MAKNTDSSREDTALRIIWEEGTRIRCLNFIEKSRQPDNPLPDLPTKTDREELVYYTGSRQGNYYLNAINQNESLLISFSCEIDRQIFYLLKEHGRLSVPSIIEKTGLGILAVSKSLRTLAAQNRVQLAILYDFRSQELPPVHEYMITQDALNHIQ